MADKAIFIDRDDTLIDDPGLITNPDQVQLLPEAAQALVQFKKLGYLIFIVTNQPCVARGDVTEDQLEGIHRQLKRLLAEEGASVDEIYYCPYHPDGTIKKYAIESELRKPQPGMLLKAAADYDVDLDNSWMIGDRFGDIRAGKSAGCRTILVDVPGKPREQKPDDPDPDRKAVNLREAVNIIRMFEFHQKARNIRDTHEIVEPPVKIQPVVDAIEPESPVETMNSETESVPKPDISNLLPATEPTPSAKVESNSKVFTAKKMQTSMESDIDDASQDSKTHQMLEEMLRSMKKNNREDLYRGEFSVFKLLAMLFQAIAGLCLIFSIWFWLSPERNTDSVTIMIGYAATLQLTVIALMMFSSE